MGVVIELKISTWDERIVAAYGEATPMNLLDLVQKAITTGMPRTGLRGDIGACAGLYLEASTLITHSRLSRHSALAFLESLKTFMRENGISHP